MARSKDDYVAAETNEAVAVSISEFEVDNASIGLVVRINRVTGYGVDSFVWSDIAEIHRVSEWLGPHYFQAEYGHLCLHVARSIADDGTYLNEFELVGAAEVSGR